MVYLFKSLSLLTSIFYFCSLSFGATPAPLSATHCDPQDKTGTWIQTHNVAYSVIDPVSMIDVPFTPLENSDSDGPTYFAPALESALSANSPNGEPNSSPLDPTNKLDPRNTGREANADINYQRKRCLSKDEIPQKFEPTTTVCKGLSMPTNQMSQECILKNFADSIRAAKQNKACNTKNQVEPIETLKSGCWIRKDIHGNSYILKETIKTNYSNVDSLDSKESCNAKAKTFNDSNANAVNSKIESLAFKAFENGVRVTEALQPLTEDALTNGVFCSSRKGVCIKIGQGVGGLAGGVIISDLQNLAGSTIFRGMANMCNMQLNQMPEDLRIQIIENMYDPPSEDFEDQAQKWKDQMLFPSLYKWFTPK